MPWSAQVAVQLQAGNTIINPSGVFVYNSNGPGLGNLIVSEAPAAGTDQFGNAFVEGSAAYVTIAGTIYALEVGAQTGSGNAFLVHNLTNPPTADPLFSAISAAPTGCIATMNSGQSTAGSGAAAVEVADSTASGVTGGQVDLVCGSTILNNIATPIPAAHVTGFPLPSDNNSGSTWVSGERAFMNNSWITPLNSLYTALVSAGIFSS